MISRLPIVLIFFVGNLFPAASSSSAAASSSSAAAASSVDCHTRGIPPRIGIIGVDNAELGNLYDLMDKQPRREKIGMRTAYEGKLWGVNTVILISNVGKVAAASAATELILNYQVDAIIFMGTAGALDKRANIGDVVIPKKVLYFDVDFTPYSPIFKLPSCERDIETDDHLSRLLSDASLQFFQKKYKNSSFQESLKRMQIASPCILTSSIGTADCFLVKDRLLEALQIDAPETVCVDMESAAIAQAAQHYKIPFAVMRTVANYVETPSSLSHTKADVDYNSFCQQVQKTYVRGIIKELLHNIGTVERKNMIGAPMPRSTKKNRIGIVCNRSEMARSFAEKLGLDTIHYVGKNICYSGNYADNELIVAATGFGKTAAAITATELIVKYGIDELICLGTACAMSEALQTGDIVISESLVQFDVDVRPFRPEYELPTLSITALPSDKTLQSRIYYAIKKTMEGKQKVSVVCGQIASGDRSLKDARDMQSIKKGLPDLLCIDSQSASAAQVAYQYKVKFVAVNEISEHDAHYTSSHESDAIKEFDKRLLCDVLKSLFFRAERDE